MPRYRFSFFGPYTGLPRQAFGRGCEGALLPAGSFPSANIRQWDGPRYIRICRLDSAMARRPLARRRHSLRAPSHTLPASVVDMRVPLAGSDHGRGYASAAPTAASKRLHTAHPVDQGYGKWAGSMWWTLLAVRTARHL